MRNSLARILRGDARDVLPQLPADSVQCVVTSPPYWGLRDYDNPPSVWGGDADCAHRWGAVLPPAKAGPGNKAVSPKSSLTNPVTHFETPRAKNAGSFCRKCGAWLGCLGLEPSPTLYVEHLVSVFRDVRRVLRRDGCVWLNLGDCYAQGGRGAQHGRGLQGSGCNQAESRKALQARGPAARKPPPGLKAKDLVGIPWMVAFALRVDGWYLRADIIWHKPNPMPESIEDRPTKAHEYVFLLTRSERYFYDKAAIAELAVETASGNEQRKYRGDHGGVSADIARSHQGFSVPWSGTTRNRRSVWTVTTKPFAGAHFAVMPPDLVEPCILAGSRAGDTVLDPFGGSGTVAVVALRLGRAAVLCELNASYAEMARERIHSDAPLLNSAEVA